jgi:hypothetical protein
LIYNGLDACELDNSQFVVAIELELPSERSG